MCTSWHTDRSLSCLLIFCNIWDYIFEYSCGTVTCPLSCRMRADIYCWTRYICTHGIASSASTPASMYEGSSRPLHGQSGWLASVSSSSLPETMPSFRSSRASTAMFMRTSATMPGSWWSLKVLISCFQTKKSNLCLSKSTESTWRSVKEWLKTTSRSNLWLYYFLLPIPMSLPSVTSHYIHLLFPNKISDVYFGNN